MKNLQVPVPPEVLVGLRTSDDAGVYRLAGDLCLVVTADFITPTCDDPFLYGRIAAANSLSDVYAMGGEPKVALNLCCFPTKGPDKGILTDILRGGLETINDSGATLIGGHTVKDNELKYGLSVTGIVREKDIKANAGAKPGDLVVLTKPLGTGVVLSGNKSGLADAKTVDHVLQRMAELNRTACEIMNAVGANAATDVTGFGLGGHSYEVAKASKVGIRYFESKVPRWSLAESLIQKGVKTGVTLANGQSLESKVRFAEGIGSEKQMLFFDPQTSGGLLIFAPEPQAREIHKRLVDAGIEDAAICGEVFSTDRPHLEIEP